MLAPMVTRDADVAVAKPPVLAAVVLFVALRGVTTLATLLVLWPLLGIAATLVFGTSFFAAAVSAELLFTAIFVVTSAVVAARVRRDPVRWQRAAVQVGWVLLADVVLYLGGVLAVAAAGSNLVSWTVLPSIIAGNLVLLWLAVRIVRRARALAPPPEDEVPAAR
jgi:hypothetical protein